MGLNIQFESEHLNREKIEKMWQLIAKIYGYSEDVVNVQEISEKEIQKLNEKYKGKDKATNVLTFSYDEGEHDVSLCLVIARQEAKQRNLLVEEYVAMLLAHAFLHVVGVDHRDSINEQEMRQAEMKFLKAVGFDGGHL